MADFDFLEGFDIPLTHRSIIVVSRSPYSTIMEFLGDVAAPIFTIKSLENTLE